MIDYKQIIASIIVVLIVISLGTLIFFGLGNLIIYVFDIDYAWTWLHGLACQLVYMLLKGMFSNK